MNKSWMTKAKWSREYRTGVESFLEFAIQGKNSLDKILCPCRVCINRYFYSMGDVKEHLFSNGMFVGYTVWNRHGEEHMVAEAIREEEILTAATSTQFQPQNEQPNLDDIEGLLRDTIDADNIQENICGDTETPNAESSKVDQQCKETFEDELYPGCKSFSKLSFVIHLFRLKCLHSWTSKSFDMLLELLINAFPEGIQLPKNTYEVKKIMKEFDLGYTKIDACPNDCMLFWKDKSEQKVCDTCGSERWEANLKGNYDKGKNSKKKSAKIIRYFPLIPRLQRLFKTKKSAEDMIWHDKFRNKDGLLRHPADAQAWKSFDARFPDFAADPRNVRIGLASDGFNPFKNMSSTYSIWPIVLVPYNLAPWIGMKQTSFILSTIIAGPKSPGNDIDIYMQPLIEELCELWNGVQTYDAST